MSKLSYEEMRKIELDATKKLINYVKKEVNVEEILEEINFTYPFFKEANNRLAFNIWLSTDYINKDGQSFIDRFLDTNSHSLKALEIEALVGKNKSYVSLFQIIGYNDEFMIVKDVLLNEQIQLWEPGLNSVLNEGDFIFSRLAYILGNYSFIGEINYLPDTVKPLFIEEFLISLNKKRRINTHYTVRDYLKIYSLELYEIYNDCIIEAIEESEDITTFLYDEIDEFNNYLQNKVSRTVIKQHISNLIEFFEYYLSDEDLTLYDMDQIDFKYFFKNAIKDGFINSQEELNSYLSTFIKYVSFLNNKTSLYSEVCLELTEISKDRFNYMEKLKALSTPFNIDKGLADGITLNETAITLIIYFDKFLLYAIDKPLELTAKNKYIKRKHLIELEELFDEDIIISMKNPNQKDFPIIHLFYNVCVRLGLMSIDGNYLTITKKGTSFIRLRDEEKFTLLLNYIWNNDFIKEITELNNNIIEILKKDFVELILSFNINNNYSIATVISTFEDFPNFFVKYNRYLKYLGLIKTSFYPDYNFEITNLGKTVFKYLKEKYDKPYPNTIVHLDNYRKKSFD